MDNYKTVTFIMLVVYFLVASILGVLAYLGNIIGISCCLIWVIAGLVGFTIMWRETA